MTAPTRLTLLEGDMDELEVKHRSLNKTLNRVFAAVGVGTISLVGALILRLVDQGGGVVP
jgi:hypothetical protein